MELMRFYSKLLRPGICQLALPLLTDGSSPRPAVLRLLLMGKSSGCCLFCSPAFDPFIPVPAERTSAFSLDSHIIILLLVEWNGYCAID
jgi:hypothetical protein